jgi:catechol-2,3-dioxygenase
MTQGNISPIQAAPDPIDPGVRIGHVHLRTADIDRVRDFYVGVLGFDVVAEERDVPGWGTTGDILFVSAGGYHHHLGFNTWKSAGGGPQPDGVAGLHHVALNYPTRAGLADAEDGCSEPASRFASFQTTAPTRRSISPIPTATISNWLGIGPSISGHGPRAAASLRSSTTST